MPNTPYIGMTLPVVGVTPGGGAGTSWGPLLTQSMDQIDAHDHSPGKGAPLNLTAPQFVVAGDLGFGGHSLFSIQGITASGSIVATAFTGSLTQLGSGLAYMVGIGGIYISTNSLGQVIISSSAGIISDLTGTGGTTVSAFPVIGGTAYTVSSSRGADDYGTYLQLSSSARNPAARVFVIGSGSGGNLVFTDNGPGNTFTLAVKTFPVFIDQGGGRAYTTSSINVPGGITGSLTQTSTGLAYIVGVGGVTATTNSLGQIIVSSSAPGLTDLVGTGGSTVTNIGTAYTVSSSKGADDFATYLQLNVSARNPNARIFSVAGGIASNDGGAGGLYTISSSIGSDKYALYLLLAPNTNDPNARTAVAAGGTSFIDGGAGGNLTISSSVGADKYAAYILFAPNPNDPNARVLVASGGVQLIDFGAGGVLAVSSSIGADKYGAYLLLSGNVNDPNARILTSSGGTSFADTGAGGTLTLSSSIGADRYGTYLLVSSNPNDPNARTVVVGSGSGAQVVLTDGGPGGSLQIGVKDFDVWSDQGNSIYTTGSVSIDSQGRQAVSQGNDVFFFVSGTVGLGVGNAARKVALFGGTTVFSGTLHALTGVSIDGQGASLATKGADNFLWVSGTVGLSGSGAKIAVFGGDVVMSGALLVSGNVTTTGQYIGSGAFGQLTSFTNANSQTLTTGGVFYQIVNFTTASLTGSNMITSTANNNLVIKQPGLYLLMANISWTAGADNYTFALFVNGNLNMDNQIIQTAGGGGAIQTVTLADPDFMNAGDIVDLRVSATGNNRTFTMNNGTFWAVRVIGLQG